MCGENCFNKCGCLKCDTEWFKFHFRGIPLNGPGVYVYGDLLRFDDNVFGIRSHDFNGRLDDAIKNVSYDSIQICSFKYDDNNQIIYIPLKSAEKIIYQSIRNIGA